MTETPMKNIEDLSHLQVEDRQTTLSQAAHSRVGPWGMRFAGFSLGMMILGVSAWAVSHANAPSHNAEDRLAFSPSVMSSLSTQGLRAGQMRAGFVPSSKGSGIDSISGSSFVPKAARGASITMSTNKDAPIKLGVNGFGRIGRQVVRIAMDRDEFVLNHINSPMDADYMRYLLEHDTVHGRFKGTCELNPKGDGLIINGYPVSITGTRDPTEIPWKEKGVEYVCESTGAFTTTEGCKKHIEAGAKKVVISAPAKDEDTPTIVVGVNTDDYDPKMEVVSCASCTTNGLAPLVKVINEKFGIKQGLMTTVHASTASQYVVDSSSKKDWRGGRAAGANIIPSSTGAAKAVAKAYPIMKGKLTGMAFRVPTQDVSVVDLTCDLETETTYEDIKKEVKLASETYAKGVVGYTEDSVVSSDFIGETCSTVFDAGASIMLTPTFVKLVSWYDNEWGYSTRLVDLIGIMAKKDGVVKEGRRLSHSDGELVYITAREPTRFYENGVY